MNTLAIIGSGDTWPGGPAPSGGTSRRALVGAAALLLGGHMTPAGAATDLADLHQKAKPEGRIILYSSQPPAINERLIAAFRTSYPGIDIDVLRLATGPLGRRFEAETSAGAYVADVLQLADPVLIASVGAKGWLAPLGDLPAHDAFPATFKLPHTATVRIDPHTLTINDQNVTSDKAPKSWTDALDPRWKGRILCPDPRISIMLINWAALMIDAYGPDYLARLAAQGIRWLPGQIQGSQLLGAGEADLLLPNQKQVTASLIESGAPLRDVIPSPYAGHEGVVAIPAKAPHPASARLLADFIMSRPGAAVLNRGVSYSPLPDIPGALPMPANYKRLDAQSAAQRQGEILELLKIK